MTERAPRDRCRLPAPSWCDGGRALSGALLTGVQACAAELEEEEEEDLHRKAKCSNRFWHDFTVSEPFYLL